MNDRLRRIPLKELGLIAVAGPVAGLLAVSCEANPVQTIVDLINQPDSRSIQTELPRRELPKGVNIPPLPKP